MSELLLVRHGQAAAFEVDSDRLTELGHLQSRKLGEYLLQQGLDFDEVVTGSLRRHRETEAAVSLAFREAGRSWPEPRAEEGWNEYDAPSIMAVLLPKLAGEDSTFAALMAAFEGSPADRGERNRRFQRMFEVLMSRWTTGQIEAPGVETFAAFHARTAKARAAILERSGSRRVIVFTSGGPIGACVQMTVNAPAPMALEINWRVRNTSLTEFLFSQRRVSLDGFNQIPHLVDPALRTFR
jgi:broad specificity phosphatase PhoE